MRKTSNKNWSISCQTIHEPKLKLRSEIGKIKLKDNITIIASQAGSGKTTRVIKHIEKTILSEIEKNEIIIKENTGKKKSEQKPLKKTTFAIYAKNHKLLRDEYLPDLKKYGAVHVKGVTYVDPITNECMCPEPKMVKLHKKLKSVNVVCFKICEKSKEEKEECPYFSQNKNAQIILAPIDILRDNIKRDEIIIDENIVQVEEIKKAYDASKLISAKLKLAIKNNNAKWIFDNAKLIRHLNSKAEERYIKNEEWEKLAKITKFNIQNQIFLTRNKLEVWYKPKLYDVFGIASQHENTKISMLCATFNEEYFVDMLKFYSGEIGIKKLKMTKTTEYIDKLEFQNNKLVRTEIPKIMRKKDYEESNISVKIYNTKTENKDAIVYHINPQHKYVNSEPSDMLETMQIIHEKYPEVGCIGRKEFIDELGFGLHYNAAEGSNKFNNSDLFIKIGSYAQNIEAHAKEYQQHYMDFSRPKFPKKDNAHVLDIYKWIKEKYGRKCESFIQWRNKAKNHDAVHRNRGLWNGYRCVVVFGIMPKGISEEFTLKEFECKNENIESFIENIIEDLENVKDEYFIKLYNEYNPEPLTEDDFYDLPDEIFD
ncbi:MAG: hypothetical protein KAT05_15535 [Spirochaetes bacterium]|nr:hypothetical protein [Spirochaetota bacterium]